MPSQDCLGFAREALNEVVCHQDNFSHIGMPEGIAMFGWFRTVTSIGALLLTSILRIVQHGCEAACASSRRLDGLNHPSQSTASPHSSDLGSQNTR